MPALVACGARAGSAGNVADNLNLIFVLGIGPDRIVRPEKSHNFSSGSDSDMPRARIIGDDKVRNRKKGLELPKSDRFVGEADKTVFA